MKKGQGPGGYIPSLLSRKRVCTSSCPVYTQIALCKMTALLCLISGYSSYHNILYTSYNNIPPLAVCVCVCVFCTNLSVSKKHKWRKHLWKRASHPTVHLSHDHNPGGGYRTRILTEEKTTTSRRCLLKSKTHLGTSIENTVNCLCESIWDTPLPRIVVADNFFRCENLKR